jgi:hypothetical protein
LPRYAHYENNKPPLQKIVITTNIGAQINIASTALQEWSAHYNAIAQEQQRNHNTLPDRMPSMDSVEEMMRHQVNICTALQRMQSIIHEQATIDQRMREQGNRPGEYEDEMGMYGDDMKNHGYTSEGKKRRGVSRPDESCIVNREGSNMCSSVLLPPVVAIVATEPKLPNGEGAPMELERSAMLVGFTMPN